MASLNVGDSQNSVEPQEPLPCYDLVHHVALKPLDRQYSELIAIHFGSFALARGPLMSRQKAKKFVKYLWSFTLELMPCDHPVQLPPITSHDINYAISYANVLIKRGKALARLLAISDFEALTHAYPDDDVSFVCASPGEDCAEDTISVEDGPFRHPAIGIIISRMLTFDSKGDICLSKMYFYPKVPKVLIIFVCGLIRFALDELNTGAYVKLSFSEWTQEYSWSMLRDLWDLAEGIEDGAYMESVQRDLAVQLRESIANSRHPALDSPPSGPLFPWDLPSGQDDTSSGHDTDTTLVN